MGRFKYLERVLEAPQEEVLVEQVRGQVRGQVARLVGLPLLQ